MLSRLLARNALKQAATGGSRRSHRAAWSLVRDLHSSVPLRSKDEEVVGPSLAEKYKLTDPTRYVPLTLGGLGFGTMTGLYHIDAESQLLVLWVLFCGTIYSRVGPLIGESLDEMIDQIAEEHKKAEDAEIEAVEQVLEAHRRQVAIYEDIDGLFTGYQELVAKVSATAQNRLHRATNEVFTKKLDMIVQAEAKQKATVQGLLVQKATESVKAAYANDTGGVKTKAFDAALLALSNPNEAKKDPTVGQLYTSFFANVKKQSEAFKNTKVKFTPEQVAEMKETLEALGRREGWDTSRLKIPTEAVAP